MHPHKQRQLRYTAALVSALIVAAGSARGQQAPASPTDAPKTETAAVAPKAAVTESSEEVLELSPFEVSASDDSKGYISGTTLAGNRLSSEVRDLGTSVSVVNSQFLKDIDAKDNQSLLKYTLGTEVGNYNGNFAGAGDGAFLNESDRFSNPNQNTRVRGLTYADNTRDFFLSTIPWDGYYIEGVDLQRGPNSILFGQGSPAGIINNRTKSASFKSSSDVSVRVDNDGSFRESLDLNRVLVKGQLAFRLAAVADDTKYKQKPAYSKSRRVFGAGRWEPAFLKGNGARTVVKANFEAGDIKSNNPRALPPIDLITPWFKTGTYKGYDLSGVERTYSYLNRQTFIPAQLQDDNTGLPNHGQMRPKVNGGPNAGNWNPYYNPYLGNFGSQFGGPLVNFNSDGSNSLGAYVDEVQTPYGIGPNGAIDKGLAMPFQRPTGVATEAQFAINTRKEFAKFGVYKNNQITDPSIFNFYTNLLDGPNKREWQNFHVYNVSVAQTFFTDAIGFEITRNAEHYRGGQLSLLAGQNQAIYIDINKTYSDGTPAGKDGETYADGTPNPNLGRAFVSDNGLYGNNETTNDYSTNRATLFANYDFAKGNRSSVLMRALGQHTVTALFAKDEQKSKYIAWQRYTATEDYAKFLFPTDYLTKGINDNALVPNLVIYMGGSLASHTTASGANLPRLTAQQVVKNGSVYTFDSHWNRSTDPESSNYVDPSAFWFNQYYPADQTAGNSTQSENPANYVGWKQVPVSYIDSEAAPGNRELLASALHDSLARESSKAIIWQGKIWDNSVIGTYGIRNDNVSGDQYNRDRGNNHDFPTVTPPPTSKHNETSKSWSIVGHLNKLPFISALGEKLPFQLSVSYNHSTNFQPAALRTDLYGQPLDLPHGKTNDIGILIETNDGKYSLRINKFTSTVANASSTALNGSWFIGASQAWGGNWANRFEFDWSSDVESGKIENPGSWQLSEWNYGTGFKKNPTTGLYDIPETTEEAAAREQQAIAGWRTWQASVDPRFYKAWGINLNDHTKSISATAPGGFTVTEDATAKGYEIELNAQPTKNWRLTLNASRINSVRKNIGGKLLTDFINAYQAAINPERGAGDVRIWWGGAGNETTNYQWYQNIGGEWASRKLQEGSNVPESRLWHVNLITNYDFDRGFLKGFNFGGGLRYESSVIIGYKPIQGATANDVTFDLAHPYKGPDSRDFDVWFGYNRKLTSKINWNIQLNIQNLLVGNELIPITVQPDGTPAGYRIRPPQVISLTNTFSF